MKFVFLHNYSSTIFNL